MDQTILTFFNQTLTHPLLDILMLLFTYGGLALLPGIAGILLLSKQYRLGLAILMAMTSSLTVTLLFQYLALRPRPEAVRLLVATPNFPAYPSGHAALAFAVAVVLALAYRRWWLPLLGGAGLIALSRVYLGLHFPSDVSGGAVLGATFGAASYGLIVGRWEWRWCLWPQVGLMAIITQMAYLDLLQLGFLTWPLIDKLLHFGLFGLVVFWLDLWLEGRSVRSGRWELPLALLIPLLIASAEEAAQAWSPVRTASLLDWLSDIAGMLFFWALSRRRHYPKLSEPVASGRITLSKL